VEGKKRILKINGFWDVEGITKDIKELLSLKL